MKTEISKAVIVMLAFALGFAGCNDNDSGAGTPLNTGLGPPNFITVDADGNTSFDIASLKQTLSTYPLGTISAAEEEGLVYMREEEKLAHDVYAELGSLWMHNTFANISQSEETHMQAVLALLERYSITDPVGDNTEGVFTDPTLQGLYDMLVATGSASLIDGLIVGAEIEEIDLIDIASYLTEVSGNNDIVLVYENLMKGSRNHLRAFVRALDAQNVTYEPRHLTQEEFDDVINSPMETGMN